MSSDVVAVGGVALYENRTKTPPSFGCGCSSKGLKFCTEESSSSLDFIEERM